jgi:hypothetical protein
MFMAPRKEELEGNVSYRQNRKRRVGEEGTKWRRKRGKIKINI